MKENFESKTFALSKKELDKIKKCAKVERRNLSNMLRVMIESYREK